MMAVKMPCSGLTPRGDREGHRQRQRDDADRDAGADVGGEAAAVVAGERVDQARPEALQPQAAGQPSRGGRHGAAARSATLRRA